MSLLSAFKVHTGLTSMSHLLQVGIANDRPQPGSSCPLATSLTNQNSPNETCSITRECSGGASACASHLMPPQWQVICLLLIWSLLIVLAAVVCCASCLLPFWIAGSVEVSTSGGRVVSSVSHLGLFRRCGYPVYEANGDVGWMQGCGYYPTLESVPHWVWRMALLLLIVAACLLVLLAFVVISATVCTSLPRRSWKWWRACSCVHLVAGTLCLVACIAYPFGWSNNSEISQICGHHSANFKLGRCEVGWAYVLTIACGVISVVLSGMPNMLQSLLQCPTLPPPLSRGDAKSSLLPSNYSHSHLHPHPHPHSHHVPPWCVVGNSVFLGGSGGGVNWNVRRRPRSLVVACDFSSLSAVTRRLSCSDVCAMPGQQQTGLPATRPSECQSFATIPEDEVAIYASKVETNELLNGDAVASRAENVD